MRITIITILASLLISQTSFAQKRPAKTPPKSEPAPIVVMDDDLSTKQSPKKYLKRSEPVIKVALVYYGDYYSPNDLDRVNTLLKKRFEAATGNLLRMDTVIQKIVPFKHNIS